MEAEAEDTMEADDVSMLKHLEKNLLRLQLSGIAGISKVRACVCVCVCWALLRGRLLSLIATNEMWNTVARDTRIVQSQRHLSRLRTF